MVFILRLGLRWVSQMSWVPQNTPADPAPTCLAFQSCYPLSADLLSLETLGAQKCGVCRLGATSWDPQIPLRRTNQVSGLLAPRSPRPALGSQEPVELAPLMGANRKPVCRTTWEASMQGALGPLGVPRRGILGCSVHQAPESGQVFLEARAE